MPATPKVHGRVEIIGRVDNRRAGKPDDYLAEVRVEHDYDPAIAVYLTDPGSGTPLGLTPHQARWLAEQLVTAATRAERVEDEDDDPTRRP